MVFFIDIDGTLVEHEGPPSKQWFERRRVLPGAAEFLDALEKHGHHIVLTSARGECCRAQLEALLVGLPYHRLIMGLPKGDRMLIDDRPCGAVQVTRNHEKPLSDEVWERLPDNFKGRFLVGRGWRDHGSAQAPGGAG